MKASVLATYMKKVQSPTNVEELPLPISTKSWQYNLTVW